MTVEKIDKMPEIQRGVRFVFRELIQLVKDSSDGEVIKFSRDDDKKVNATTLRKSIEQHTGKMVIVKKTDVDTACIQLLSKEDAKKEELARKERAKEMKAKLEGKGK